MKVRRKVATPPAKPRRIVTRSELHRLSFCNSKRLPTPCVIEGVVKRWVGFGWVALDRKPLPTDAAMIEDADAPKEVVARLKRAIAAHWVSWRVDYLGDHGSVGFRVVAARLRKGVAEVRFDGGSPGAWTEVSDLGRITVVRQASRKGGVVTMRREPLP